MLAHSYCLYNCVDFFFVQNIPISEIGFIYRSKLLPCRIFRSYMYNLYFSTCSEYSTKATTKRRKDVQKQEKEVKKENEATTGKMFKDISIF